MKTWFKIENKGAVAEVWIYEQIGEDFWSGGGTTAKSFQAELAKIKAGQIDLHINCPGGEVFDGITIYNLIKQHPANVTTYIDGLAASIASLIALAGNQVKMADNALFMIHNPWGMTAGDSKEMRRMADRLDKVSGSLWRTSRRQDLKTRNLLSLWMQRHG
jgi:ATP-dependent protease ClpP protease subunit